MVAEFVSGSDRLWVSLPFSSAFNSPMSSFSVSIHRLKIAEALGSALPCASRISSAISEVVPVSGGGAAITVEVAAATVRRSRAKGDMR